MAGLTIDLSDELLNVFTGEIVYAPPGQKPPALGTGDGPRVAVQQANSVESPISLASPENRPQVRKLTFVYLRLPVLCAVRLWSCFKAVFWQNTQKGMRAVKPACAWYDIFCSEG